MPDLLLNEVTFDLLTPRQLELIETKADHLLATIGVALGDSEALKRFKAAGAVIEQDRVKVEGALLRDIIKNIPETFQIKARNPEHTVKLGASNPQLFTPCYGAPNVKSSNEKRHLGNLQDYKTLVSKTHDTPALKNTGWNLCFPHDLPVESMHIDMTLAHLEQSDKSFYGAIHHPKATKDVISLTALALEQDCLQETCLIHTFNSIPPLSYPEKPLQALKVAAENHQASEISSWMMMGMTSPASIAGTLAQGYAEVMTGLALTQLYQKGSPAIMGIYGLPFSMKTMLPVLGDPGSYLIQQASVQLAKRLNVPARADGGLTMAHHDDFQSGFEAGSATYFAQQSGADLVKHSAGWLESGRTMDIEKFDREAKQLSRQSELKNTELQDLTDNVLANLNELANELRREAKELIT